MRSVQHDANGRLCVCVCTQTSMNLLFDVILRSVARWRLYVWYETKTLDWGKDLVTSCLRYNPKTINEMFPSNSEIQV